tara:strand:+ start:114 stop:413 length:300 start_codon:yes stop_codon:yes gene_type:complete
MISKAQIYKIISFLSKSIKFLFFIIKKVSAIAINKIYKIEIIDNISKLMKLLNCAINKKGKKYREINAFVSITTIEIFLHLTYLFVTNPHKRIDTCLIK